MLCPILIVKWNDQMYKEKGIFATKHEKLIEKVVEGKLENFERKEYIITCILFIYHWVLSSIE